MATFYRITVAEFGDRNAFLEDLDAFVEIFIVSETRLIELHTILITFKFFVNHRMIEHH